VEYLAIRYKLHQSVTQPTVVLYDQGIVSSATLVWLEGSGNGDRLKEFIYQILPVSSVVVSFEVGEGEALRRYKSREKINSYFVGLDESRILSTLSSLQAAYSDILSFLQTRSGIEICRVSETSTIIEKSEALEGCLTAYL
jgi:hypothetical protein